MKKILIIAAVTLLGALQLNAQNCNEICLPYFGNDTSVMNYCPAPKLAEICAQSRAFFFEADQAPEGALVFDISQLTHKITGQHPDINMVIDLDHLSYYAYDFKTFQFQDFYRTVYFRTPGSTHQYLGVRDINSAYLRAQQPENYAEEK